MRMSTFTAMVIGSLLAGEPVTTGGPGAEAEADPGGEEADGGDGAEARTAA